MCMAGLCVHGNYSQVPDCYPLVSSCLYDGGGKIVCKEYDTGPLVYEVRCIELKEYQPEGQTRQQILYRQWITTTFNLTGMNITSLAKGVFDDFNLMGLLDFSRNQIEVIYSGVFTGMPFLTRLYLEHNVITVIEDGAFSDTPLLTVIHLENNNIYQLPATVLHGVPLYSLHLQHNKLVAIPHGLISDVRELEILNLCCNSIEELEGIFTLLTDLRAVNVSSNLFRYVSKDAFPVQTRLQVLDLGRNAITYIDADAFAVMEVLYFLDLSFNPITSIDPQMFVNFGRLEFLLLIDVHLTTVSPDFIDHFELLEALSTVDNRICCLLKAKKRMENVTCVRTSPSNPLETCGSLYPSNVLRVASWVIGLSALLGNLAVLVLRMNRKQALSVQTLLTINLAVCDCLMGVYMVIITAADIHFGDSYFLSAPIWRSSYLCNFASFLAFLSSESSVLTLCLMTADRLICIVFPFGKARFSVSSCVKFLIALWLMVIAASIAPLLVSSRFPDFYGLSDVCVGLPLHVASEETGRLEIIPESFSQIKPEVRYIVIDEIFRPSWIYSVVTFIGINMVLFIFIMVSYVIMFVQIVRSGRAARNSSSSREKEIKIARKMALIVGTDFACWMPIVVMGILSQTGLVVLPVSLYAWSVIFILPINSSLNPILYTFLNGIGKRGNRAAGKRGPMPGGHGLQTITSNITDSSYGGTVDVGGSTIQKDCVIKGGVENPGLSLEDGTGNPGSEQERDSEKYQNGLMK